MRAAISVSLMWPERWRRESSPDMKTLLALFLVWPLLAQSAEQLEFFEKKIRPVFATKCYACHGPKTQTAGVKLSSPPRLTQGREQGDSAPSPLYHAVRYSARLTEPPPGKLPAPES